MKLRNNSDHEWLQYNCGSILVDILPHAEFEVDERSASVILRNLGHDNWIVKVNDDKPKELPKIVQKVQEKRFCDYCDSKGGRHKKDCTR